jgi:hypothetical protein
MRIVIGEHALPVLNWSLGGIALAKPCPFALTPGTTVSGVLELLAGHVGLSLKVTLRLVHEHPDHFGFAFVDLTSEQMGMLRALLLRNGGSPLERASLPAHRPAQPGQPASRRAASVRAARRRWWHRLAGIAAVVVAGLVIAGYALVKKSRVESVHAAVAVPARVVSLADRGYVDEIRVKPGQAVQTGDILMTVRRRAEPAKAVSLTSDCSCAVLNVAVQHGDEVVAGQPLVLLGNANWGQPFIEALSRFDVDIDVGQKVGVVIEGLPVAGRGRIIRFEAERPTATRFGLAPVLREDPRYRLLIVSEISELRPLQPGAAARIRLREDASWSELLAVELERLVGSVTHLLPRMGGSAGAFPTASDKTLPGVPGAKLESG